MGSATLIIGLLILIAVGVGVWYFFFYSKKDDDDADADVRDRLTPAQGNSIRPEEGTETLAGRTDGILDLSKDLKEACTGAFSMRYLAKGYEGPVVRVQTSYAQGSPERDFFPAQGEQLVDKDGKTLSAYLNESGREALGFVTKWYNQVSNNGSTDAVNVHHETRPTIRAKTAINDKGEETHQGYILHVRNFGQGWVGDTTYETGMKAELFYPAGGIKNSGLVIETRPVRDSPQGIGFPIRASKPGGEDNFRIVYHGDDLHWGFGQMHTATFFEPDGTPHAWFNIRMGTDQSVYDALVMNVQEGKIRAWVDPGSMSGDGDMSGEWRDSTGTRSKRIDIAIGHPTSTPVMMHIGFNYNGDVRECLFFTRPLVDVERAHLIQNRNTIHV